MVESVDDEKVITFLCFLFFFFYGFLSFSAEAYTIWHYFSIEWKGIKWPKNEKILENTHTHTYFKVGLDRIEWQKRIHEDDSDLSIEDP